MYWCLFTFFLLSFIIDSKTTDSTSFEKSKNIHKKFRAYRKIKPTNEQPNYWNNWLDKNPTTKPEQEKQICNSLFCKWKLKRRKKKKEKWKELNGNTPYV